MSQRYAFIAEWLDPNTGVLWRYQLFWYPDNFEVEMVGEMYIGEALPFSGQSRS